MCFSNNPSVDEFVITGEEFKRIIESAGLQVPVGMFDSTYYYTDGEGWASILSHMLFKSNLAKPEKFDCENYAMKAMSVCHEKYGLNTFGLALGMTPWGYHCFNILYDGMGFWLFEPNAQFGYGETLFRIGDNFYQPDRVLV